MKKTLILVFLTFITFSIKSFAGLPPCMSCYDIVGVGGGGGGTISHDHVYAGLKWTLNEGIKPQAVVGFRHARTKSNGDTQGGDFSISAKFIDGFEFGKLRAKYFDGKQSTQGEIGGGYDFTKGLFAGIGVRAPHSLLGLDMHPFLNEGKFEPYLQLDSINRYRKSRAGSASSSCVNVGDTLGTYSNPSCTPD